MIILSCMCSIGCLCALHIVLFNEKMSGRFEKVLLGILLILLCYIGANKTPPQAWDLTRHYAWLDKIRDSGISLRDLLFDNKLYLGASSDSTIVFNVLRWVIANLFDYNQALVVLCLSIDYGISFWILTDWGEEHHFSSGSYLLALLLSNTFMPYVFAYSGLRNALAYSIMGLALYLCWHKKHSTVLFIVLTSISITIHSAAIIIVPFYLLSKRRPTLASCGFVVAVPALLRTAMPLIERINNSFVRELVYQYYKYGFGRELKIPIILYYIDILCIVLFLLMIVYIRKSIPESEKESYNFSIWYMCYILANIGSGELVVRPAYLLGVLAPIYVSVLNGNYMMSKKDQKLGIFALYWLMIFVLISNFYSIRWFIKA